MLHADVPGERYLSDRKNCSVTH